MKKNRIQISRLKLFRMLREIDDVKKQKKKQKIFAQTYFFRKPSTVQIESQLDPPQNKTK